jgi:hypothetical protein
VASRLRQPLRVRVCGLQYAGALRAYARRSLGRLAIRGIECLPTLLLHWPQQAFDVAIEERCELIHQDCIRRAAFACAEMVDGTVDQRWRWRVGSGHVAVGNKQAGSRRV